MASLPEQKQRTRKQRMRTDSDILQTFGLATKTRQDGAVHRCQVFNHDGSLHCEGLGTTKEGAQDTAFHACSIINRQG